MDTGQVEANLVENCLMDLARAYEVPDKCRTLMAFDRERGQFLLLDEGWDGYRRIHTVWAHVEITDEKVWIHEDGAEEGVANLLVRAGIPRDRIVLAFHAPAMRDATEFAIA